MSDTASPAGLRVLVVEDDAPLAQQLARGLSAEGYDVSVAHVGAAVAGAQEHDLVLLDLGLPDIDGTEAVRLIRERCTIPIVVVTARGEEADRVQALDLGADDYLVKPFGLAELKARLRAVLRRSTPDASGVYQHGRLVLNARSCQVRVAGEEIQLTPREFAILHTLMREPGRVVSREEIFSRVWDEHWYGPTKVLDVHLVSLRRKLDDPELIQTVYGRGFRMGQAH